MTKPIDPVVPHVLGAVNKYKIPYRFVEVIWDDASSNSESWVALKDIQPPEQVMTRGWLVKDDPKYVTIAASISNEELEEDVVGNTMTIPRGMIVSFRDIRVSTFKARKPRVKKKKVEPSVKSPAAVQ